MIGGNPEEIRRLARILRTQAERTVDIKDAVARGQGVPWVGLAGDRFRERLANECREMERTRAEILDAASALDRLADELEERQAAIRRAMDFVDGELSKARSTVQRFAGEVWDTLTGAEKSLHSSARRLLDSVDDLPPIGHPDWLDLARRVGG